MKTVNTYSHFNGLEFLQIRKPTLLDEVLKIVDAVDPEECRTIIQNESEGTEPKISAVGLTQDFATRFRTKGWTESFAETPTEAYSPGQYPRLPQPERNAVWESNEGLLAVESQVQFFKDRVGVNLRLDVSPLLENEQFANHLALYIGDHIDVGIEILPMKSLQAQMSSGVAYYEGEFYNVVRQGRGVPAVPLVILGISP